MFNLKYQKMENENNKSVDVHRKINLRANLIGVYTTRFGDSKKAALTVNEIFKAST